MTEPIAPCLTPMPPQPKPRSLARTLRALARQRDFRQGVRQLIEPSLGMAAWGLVTGVAMVKAGLGVPLAIFMSLTVYAGSAQLAALPLLSVGAPLWVVWMTAACVNLRFVVLSTLWRGYFGHLPRYKRLALCYLSADLTFVYFTRRYPDPRPALGQMPYFLGACATNWLAWQSASLTGIVLAEHIPVQWGLGFAGTLALLGVTLNMVKDRASVAAAVAATVVALATYHLPLKLHIVVAIAAAIITGIVVESWLHRRLPPPPIA